MEHWKVGYVSEKPDKRGRDQVAETDSELLFGKIKKMETANERMEKGNKRYEQNQQRLELEEVSDTEESDAAKAESIELWKFGKHVDDEIINKSFQYNQISQVISRLTEKSVQKEKKPKQSQALLLDRSENTDRQNCG